MRRDVKDPALTAKEKTRLRRRMDREWMSALTSSEAKCMLFLFNMVTDWGKSRDRVKQEHFVNGTKSIAGTGLSLRTVIRALASLTEKGAVTRLRTPRGHVYAINFDWSPVVEMKARKVPAKPASVPAEEPVICHTGTSRYAKLADAHLREIPVQNIPDYRSPSDGAPISPRRVRPGREKATRYVDPLDITNLRATWTAAVAEAFPDMTQAAWGRRQEMQACKFVNLDDKAKRANALDVMAWSVHSWRLIMSARFAWMTECAPPEFPKVGFMVRWREHFYDAWNDRERLRAEVTMTTHDRRVRRSMHAGMSFEEATKHAEDSDGLARARLQIAEKERHLNEMLRRSEAREKLTPEQRLARVTNLDISRMQPPRRGPVSPGREGAPTAFDTAPLDAFGGGF